MQSTRIISACIAKCFCYEQKIRSMNQVTIVWNVRKMSRVASWKVLKPLSSEAPKRLRCSTSRKVDYMNAGSTRYFHGASSFLCKSGKTDKIPSDEKKEDNQEKKPQKRKFASFFFGRFYTFVEGYQEILEKKFPGAMHVYRVFVVGFKAFSKELLQFVTLQKKVIISTTGCRSLTFKELEIYYRVPREILRVGPTLLISALPFANYIIFPIAYHFPRYLLSSHFWSIQQKAQFALEDQKLRLRYYRGVFRELQALGEAIENPTLKMSAADAYVKLGSGIHPNAKDILDLIPIFSSQPYSLDAIYGPHVKGLCRMHGIHTMYLCRRRLYERAEMISICDVALAREGIHNLRTEDLRNACYLRGLNASNTSVEDMVHFIHEWTNITVNIRPEAYSMILHLPIFITYNDPNNWALKT